MQGEFARAQAGCLVIDDAMSGTAKPSGHCGLKKTGILVRGFVPKANTNVWEELREAYYQLRRRSEVYTIAARGTGCWLALALAEQLPVNRLMLVSPATGLRSVPPALRRSLSGICGYARRNLSLCVSEILVLDSRQEDLINCFRRLCASRGGLVGVLISEKCTRSGFADLVNAASCFLLAGELPKSLAENPEMCIIYG